MLLSTMATVSPRPSGTAMATLRNSDIMKRIYLRGPLEQKVNFKKTALVCLREILLLKCGDGVAPTFMSVLGRLFYFIFLGYH
jgi:hypothetical protein